MVRLWRLAFPGTGGGHLPEAGGVMDQPAAMMDAFALIGAAARELEDQRENQR